MAGASVLEIETQGLAPVTAAQAHGKPRELFGLWMAANIEFATLTTGALATGAFGLSAVDALIAIVIGNIIGGLILAAFATYGVEYGVPQMIQGAAWFGKLGNKLPSLLNCFGGFSWFGVNTIIGGYALATVLGTPLIANIIILCIIQVAIAFVGHDLIQTAEKYFFYLLVLIFAVFSVIVSYVLGWIPYSSDYSRYLSHLGDRKGVQKSVFGNVFWGSMISCIWMEALGAIIGATISLVHPSDLFTSWLPGWFKIPLIFAIIIGTISANIINIYSAALSSLAVGFKLKQWQAALVTGFIGTVISVLAATNFIKNYESFLFFLGYWTAPWAAIVYFGHTTKRISRLPISAGFVAWIIGIAASVPFFNQYPLFVGTFANAYPSFGDISFAVGAIVATAAYFALTTAPATAVAAAE